MLPALDQEVLFPLCRILAVKARCGNVHNSPTVPPSSFSLRSRLGIPFTPLPPPALGKELNWTFSAWEPAQGGLQGQNLHNKAKNFHVPMISREYSTPRQVNQRLWTCSSNQDQAAGKIKPHNTLSRPELYQLQTWQCPQVQISSLINQQEIPSPPDLCCCRPCFSFTHTALEAPAPRTFSATSQDQCQCWRTPAHASPKEANLFLGQGCPRGHSQVTTGPLNSKPQSWTCIAGAVFPKHWVRAINGTNAWQLVRQEDGHCLRYLGWKGWPSFRIHWPLPDIWAGLSLYNYRKYL